jgi:hypothetical protein
MRSSICGVGRNQFPVRSVSSKKVLWGATIAQLSLSNEEHMLGEGHSGWSRRHDHDGASGL